MKFKIFYHRKIFKNKSIPAYQLSKIKEKIDSILTENPYSHNNITGLVGRKGMYRLRVKDYRVLYKVEGNTVFIAEIGLRSKIYK